MARDHVLYVRYCLILIYREYEWVWLENRLPEHKRGMVSGPSTGRSGSVSVNKCAGDCGAQLVWPMVLLGHRVDCGAFGLGGAGGVHHPRVGGAVGALR